MLYRMDRLIGMAVRATDGEAGKVVDAHFDEQAWTARYLVVETGGWLKRRKLLISPIAVRGVNWDERRIRINLNRRQLESSPAIDLDQLMMRRDEQALFDHYGYPDYRAGGLLWGATPYPLLPHPARSLTPPDTRPPSADGPCGLGSLREIHGYSLQALDASIGQLEEFLIDSGSWAIRYLVVNTHPWWSGQQVVIPPQWAGQVDWQQKRVLLLVERDAVQNAPEFDPSLGHARPFETNLYKHYQGAEYPLRAAINEREPPFAEQRPIAAPSSSASNWR